MRINRGQAFVIGGYTASARNFDAVVFGYFDGGKLMYAGRTRSGFTPSPRDQLFKRFNALAAETCPFANLPGIKKRSLGRRFDCRENEGMPNSNCPNHLRHIDALSATACCDGPPTCSGLLAISEVPVLFMVFSYSFFGGFAGVQSNIRRSRGQHRNAAGLRRA
jgi:hypothetical protein